VSAFIGAVRGPSSNSPNDAGDVWADRSGVNLRLFEGNGFSFDKAKGVEGRFDPIAARNLAALLVRASEESERMRARPDPEVGHGG